MRVLVVDDYPGAVHSACMLLEVLGHEAAGASSGLEALKKASEFSPDIVIVDVGLPDLNGYEVARRLRATIGTQLFIAAITGWSETEDVADAHAAGIDKHVVKPTSAEKLREIIDAARAHQSSSRA